MPQEIECVLNIKHTNNGVQSEGTLSEDFFVAGHRRPLLTSFPVQVSEHHVDLKQKRTETS